MHFLARSVDISLTVVLILILSLASAVSAMEVPPRIHYPGKMRSFLTTPLPADDRAEGWETSQWGDNQASFESLKSGYRSLGSLKVTVTNHKSGDGKWMPAMRSVTPGAYYRYTDYYKSNASTKLVLMVERSDGDTHYHSLPNAPAAANWTKYTTAFRLPDEAVKVAVLHVLAHNGSLVTDGHSLASATPRKLKTPLLSLTFDDGWEENINSMLLPVKDYGFKTTQFFATRYLKESPMAASTIQRFKAEGHEIGSHSVNHPDLTLCSVAELESELKDSKAYLESLVGRNRIIHFAAPFGTYDDRVLTRAQKYYQSYRSTDEGLNYRDGFDPYNVRVRNIQKETSAEEVRQWLIQAKESHSWLVLVYHRVTPEPGTYDTTPELFDAHLKEMQASGIPVLTYGQAFREMMAQR